MTVSDAGLRRCGRRSRHRRGRLRVVNIFRVLIRLDGNLITQHKTHFRNRNNDLILDAKVLITRRNLLTH